MSENFIKTVAITLATVDGSNDPTPYYLSIIFTAVFFFTMLAGITGYVSRHKRRRFNFFEFIGEMCISGFVGLATFMLCYWMKMFDLFGPRTGWFDETWRGVALAVFLSGIMAHNSTRAIGRLQMLADKLLGKDIENDKDKSTESRDK